MTNTINTKSGKLILLSTILYLLSFVLPFLDESTGLEFFAEGISLFFRKGIQLEFLILFAAFYLPLFSFPVFGRIAWTRLKMPRFFRGASLVFLLAPQSIILFKVVQRIGSRYFDERLIGYGVLLVAYALLVWAIYSKKEKLSSGTDFSAHLIDENDR